MEPRCGVTEQASQAVRAGEMKGVSGWVVDARVQCGCHATFGTEAGSRDLM